MENEVPKTMSVPEAGRRYFGLAKNASYAAAARREIPTIKIGARLRVPVIALDQMLEQAAKIGVEMNIARVGAMPDDDAAPPRPPIRATFD
jgi:hypothetical protein